MVCDYFSSLYGSQHQQYEYLVTNTQFQALTQEASEQLKESISTTTIKSALHSIGSYKAPGPSGFPAQFFKEFWPICGDDLCSFVRSCFVQGTIPPSINKTLLVLILKQKNLTVMQHIRPISLCETIYKIIAKIIVDRLRPHLQHLVEQTQTSFVPGRHITDNIIIAQEVLHSFTKAKRKIGLLCMED